MTPVDHNQPVCPHHVPMTHQIGTVMVETQKQTQTLKEIKDDLGTLNQAIAVHQAEHKGEEKSKDRWKWVAGLLVAAFLALLGKGLLSQSNTPDEIAAAIVKAQKANGVAATGGDK